MVTFFTVIAFFSLFVLFYIYFGYPILLFILGLFFSKNPIRKKNIRPSVTLIISCYNEEKVIQDKINNALQIDYPKDKLEIIAVSDASTDRTDEIVGKYVNQGVRLIRQEDRLGKTAGLNLAVPQSCGEIIVFSDANAMYNSDAVIQLVENFADDGVGYVVGEARYKDVKSHAAAKSESTYWCYEIFVKKMESRVHSVVGGDGAIYAIRRELYEELLPTDINDFVNPLQIIAKGYRGVYEPNAICWEKTAGSFKKEFDRKVRIVNRSFSGLLRVKSVLNPFKTGIFSLEIITHKTLRWFAAIFILCFIISSFVLSLYSTFFQWITLLIILFLLCAYIGHLFASYHNIWSLFYYPYYFIFVNVASMIGIYRRFSGKVQATWDPSRIKEGKEQSGMDSMNFLIHMLAFAAIWFFLITVGTLSGITLFAYKAVFGILFAIIVYVYFGYPLLLLILSKAYYKPVQKKTITPEVTLLICAYNEQEVIAEKIENSCAIDYPPEKLKIVIASDGSSDKTNAIVKQYVGDRLILFDYPERRGKIGCINETIPRIDSEIIVFSDANTMYKSDAIQKLVNNFNDPSVGAVSANVILENEEKILGKSESLYYKYERRIQEMESASGSLIGADGGMYAIRRDLFTTPSDNIILDDFVISMNVAINGYRLVYDKEALGYEKSTISYKTEFFRKSRVIAGAIQAIKQKEGVPSITQKQLFLYYFSHKFLRWMIPLFLLLLFVITIRLVLGQAGFVFSAAMAFQVVFYLLALIGLFYKESITRPILSIPFYYCLVNSAALLGIYKGLLNRQSVKWQMFDRK